MNVLIAGILLILASITAAAPAAELSPVDRSAALRELVAAIRKAPLAESFRVVCVIRVSANRGKAWYDSVPKIGYCPIESSGPAITQVTRATLALLVERAAQDSCGLARGCVFDGRYAFRFHDREPPLDLVISEGCQSWEFHRGDKSVTADVGLTGFTDCIQDSLRRLMATAFEEADRSFEGGWPLELYH